MPVADGVNEKPRMVLLAVAVPPTVRMPLENEAVVDVAVTAAPSTLKVMLDEGVGLKVAIHARGSVVDPDTISRDPQPEDEAPIRAMVREYIPRGDGPTIAVRICMYSNTRDSHFVIDRHPQHERVICALACSGHGFKFASVVGEIVADLATSGRTELPIEFLSAKRVLTSAGS